MKKILLLFLFLFTSAVFCQTVYVTKTGEKYHREGCQHLRKSSSNIDLEEALRLSYEACKVCKPPKSASTSKNVVSQKNNNVDSSSSNTKSVQCSGKTKKGVRCKRMTTISSKRCYQH